MHYCFAGNNFVADLPNLTVQIGSGVTEENMETYMDANALIVGSYFKKDGYWGNNVDVQKTKSFMNKIRALRTKRESKL